MFLKEGCLRSLGQEEAEYNPSFSLDGVSRWDTPEEKQKENAWIKEFKKLEARLARASAYVRMLLKFYVHQQLYRLSGSC